MSSSVHLASHSQSSLRDLVPCGQQSSSVLGDDRFDDGMTSVVLRDLCGRHRRTEIQDQVIFWTRYGAGQSEARRTHMRDGT